METHLLATGDTSNAMVEGAYAHAKDDNGKIRTDEYKHKQPMEQVRGLVLVRKNIGKKNDFIFE